jgi:CBS domain-containing protein
MAVDKLMRRPPATLPPSATCIEAARVMRDERVGSVVVVDEGRPLGIVTDRDLAVRVIAQAEDPAALTVGDVMTKMPAFASASRGIDHVIELMRDLAVRRIPIVDERQRAVGLVSLDDLIVLLADQLSAIAETIRKEMPGP